MVREVEDVRASVVLLFFAPLLLEAPPVLALRALWIFVAFTPEDAASNGNANTLKSEATQRAKKHAPLEGLYPSILGMLIEVL